MHIAENKSTEPVTDTSSGRRSFFQPKLTVNTPGDQHEQEADRMADQVMRMPMGDQPFFKPGPVSISRLQRKCRDCEDEEKMQRKEDSSQPTEASGEVSSYISSLSSKGSPLPDSARSFFEPRFGQDFSGVRIHDDADAAKSSQSVNALAYTVDNNIVFNQNQFSPETDGGKRLLAHELTHVVQQSAAQPGIQRKELTPAERIDDCLKQKDGDILPGHVGLLTQIDRSQMLEEMFGAELPGIISKIKADTAARRFICEYGVSGIAALVETQKGNSFDVPAAKAAADAGAPAKNKPGRFGRAALENWRVSDIRESAVRADAQSIGSWAKAEDRRSDDIPSPSAALNMPAANVNDIGEMISNLELLKTNYSATSTSFADVQKSLNALSKIYLNAAPTGMLSEEAGMDVSRAMDKALTQIDVLRPLIAAIGDGKISTKEMAVDLADVKTATESVKDEGVAQQKRVLAGQSPDFSDVRKLLKQILSGPLKKLKDSFADAQSKIEKTAKSLPNLLFVVNYFKALNDPKSPPPSEADMNAFNTNLDGIEAGLFFGGGPVNDGLEIMQSVIYFVRKQVAMRLAMKSATGNLPALIPTLDEVQSYFTSLNNKSTTNTQARQAYEGFARAYFQHRGVANMQDMKIAGITDVFSLPVSITGSRSIVCAGYAQMGAALMSRAGASKIIFTTAVRATTQQILANTIDEGHAIVKVTRHSESFFISNDSTFDTETEAMNVAWDHPDFPMLKGSADSYLQSVKNLEDTLSKVK